MESAWSNGKPAYRCRHGHTSATRPDHRPTRNAYVREERILEHLAALILTQTGPQYAVRRRRRTRRGSDIRPPTTAEDVIGYLRERQITLTYDPTTTTLHTDTRPNAKIVINKV